MPPVDRARLAQLLHAEQEAIATSWEQSIVRTGYVPLGPVQVHLRLLGWVDELIDLLGAESLDAHATQAIGAGVARLYYAHPSTLSETLKVLSEQMNARTPKEHAPEIQRPVATLLAELAAGFLNETRQIVLGDQETIRNALLSARQQAEWALRESEARFRALFQSAAIGIGIGDLQGRILDANAALQALLGYTQEEMRNRMVAEFMHPDDVAGVWELYQQLVTGQIDFFQLEKPFFRKGGRSVWTHLTVSLVRDANGDPQLQIAMIENVTERKQAEETIKRLNADLERRVLERTAQLSALNQELADEIGRRSAVEAERLQLLARAQAARAEAEAAQQRLAFLAEASSVLASSLDYRTTLLSLAHQAVPQLADWCAVDAADETGVLHRLAVAHVDLEKAEVVRALEGHYPAVADGLSGVTQVIETGRSEFLSEMPAALLESTPPDATLRASLEQLQPRGRMTVPLVTRGQIIGTLTLVFAESGRCYRRDDLSLAEDLAQRAALAIDSARLYRDAQQALATRDEFLSVAAHELKTPITSLRGYAQLTLRAIDSREHMDPERLRQALQVVTSQTQKLSRLVSQLLDVSRIQSGKLTPEYRDADFGELVADVVANAQHQSPDHTFILRTPGSVQITIDTLRIEQVVTNLLDNAIKYSPKGGQVEVILEVGGPQPGMVELSVRDHGLGIPAEIGERIFERFYQVESPRSHATGMGLGLYISRQIVELHGGKIWAEAPTGGGTRFVVVLPVVQAGLPEE